MPFNITLSSNQSFSTSTENDITFIDWGFNPNTPITIPFVIGLSSLNPININTVIRDYISKNNDDINTYSVQLSIEQPQLNGSFVDVISVTGPIATASIPVDEGYILTTENLEVVNTVEFQNLGLLSTGLYPSRLVFTVIKEDPNGIRLLEDTIYYEITISALAPQSILITPPKTYYGHVIGEALPPAQQLSVIAPGDFGLALPNWVTPSGGNITLFGPSVNNPNHTDYTGSGTQVIDISLNASAEDLELGQHNILSIYANGFNVGFLLQDLLLFETNEAIINPNRFDFLAIKNSIEAEPQELNIQAPGAISISAPVWLSVINDTGDFQLTAIIKPILSNNLSPGIYQGNIVVTANGVEYLVPVTHSVYETVKLGLDPNKINFTDDFNTISTFFHTQEFKVKLFLEAVTYNYGFPTENRKTLSYNLGLFNNSVDFFVGRTLNNIMKELEDLTTIQLSSLSNILAADATGFFRSYYLPAIVNLQVDFVHQSNEALNETFEFTNIRLVKGRKPTKAFNEAVVLNYYREPLRVTPNSIALFNFYKENNHQIRVYKNGVLDNEIAHAPGANRIFAFKYTFETFSPGDVVSIRLYKVPEGNIDEAWYQNEANYIEQVYILMPEGKRSYHIGYETESGCVEILEFTGDISFRMAYETNIINNYRNFKEHLRKIDSKKSQSIIINTGFIFKDNTQRLDAIVDSKRAWILNDDGTEAVELVPNSKSFTNYDSDLELYEYDVEFQINLNNDYKVNS